MAAYASILHRFILNLWEDFRTDERPLVSPRVHDHKTSAYPDVSLQVTLSGGLALAAAVDACIAGLTIYYLRQSQAAFKSYALLVYLLCRNQLNLYSKNQERDKIGRGIHRSLRFNYVVRSRSTAFFLKLSFTLMMFSVVSIVTVLTVGIQISSLKK